MDHFFIQFSTQLKSNFVLRISVFLAKWHQKRFKLSNISFYAASQILAFLVFNKNSTRHIHENTKQWKLSTLYTFIPVDLKRKIIFIIILKTCTRNFLDVSFHTSFSIPPFIWLMKKNTSRNILWINNVVPCFMLHH